MKKLVKRKKLVSGEKFYFISPMQVDYPKMAKDLISGDAIYINHPEYVLVIHDAESYDPITDTECNCFRTKAEAKKALREIKKILKYRG